MDRVIFHIDVNSAYLSWESMRRIQNGIPGPDLRTVPAAIGGDREMRHGIILAKSIPAKVYGVTTGEPVAQALRKCPNLILVPPDFALYQRCSAAFHEILHKYSPDVLKFSVDEAFMDMTGTRALFGPPVQAAYRIKNEIRDTLGFTVNVGISSNRLLAKMASDFEKPDKVHTLFPEEIQEKMWPLPVRDLFFVGKSTEKKLRTLGIHTIGELARTDEAILRGALKKHGTVLWKFANGQDASRIGRPAERKGYSNEMTTPFDVTDTETAHMFLLKIAEKLARRLRKADVQAGELSVILRYSDFTGSVHQRILTDATNVTDVIYRNACELFAESWDGSPVRLLGIGTGRLVGKEEGRQLSLFDTSEMEKRQKLDRAMDQIRKRYGDGAVQRASLCRPLEKKKSE